MRGVETFRRVLVCGSRDWTDYELLARTLGEFPGIDTLAHGAARGADRLAGQWARKRGVMVCEYPADWERMGRGAGHARNALMLKEFRPDLVLAFKDNFDREMRRGGTEHMVKIARDACIYTEVHRHPEETP